MDEHRLGLKPVLRRVWATRGHRPVVRVHHRYQWLYVYCFVRPTTGESCWLLLPTVTAAAFSAALAHFAEQVRAGPTKQVLLVLDRAGYHTATMVRVPPGIELVWLPPASPELQPAERLWPLTNEAVANRLFADLNERETVLAQRWAMRAQQPALLRAHTHYHWWPAA